jgi:cysteine-rich repeat protein
MRLARRCLVAAFLVGCSGGTSLTGGDSDPDGAETSDGTDTHGADADTPIPGDAADADTTADAGDDAGPGEDRAADAHDVPPTCGNGTLEYGEECDDGPDNSDTAPDACRLACVAPACGDGVVDTGERCDDGNRIDGDACPASCFPADEPPAVVEGEPVATDSPFDAAGRPRVVWNGDGWGVAWGAWWSLAYFALLDPDARLLAPATALPFSGDISELVWRDGGYAVAFVSSGWPGGEGGVALFDPAGAIRAGPSWPPLAGDGIDLDWDLAREAWAIAFMQADLDGSGRETLGVVAMDDRAGFLGTPILVADEVAEDTTPVVVSTTASTVVAWIRGDGILYRALPWPRATASPHAGCWRDSTRMIARLPPSPTARPSCSVGGAAAVSSTWSAWTAGPSMCSARRPSWETATARPSSRPYRNAATSACAIPS